MWKVQFLHAGNAKNEEPFLFNDTQIGELQKILNRFARLILKADYRKPRVEMLSELQWRSVKQTINLNTILFIHRMTIGKGPEYLTQRMTRRCDSQRPRTRQENSFILKSYQKASSQNSLFYKGLQLYNDFQSVMKNQNDEKVEKTTKTCAIEYVTAHFPLE